MKTLDELLLRFLESPWNVVGAGLAALLVALAALYLGQVLFFARLIGKSLFRNKLRTGLTGLATAFFVLIVTGVWTVLYFLDLVTSEKTKDLKAIVTERWQIPSQMPYSYAYHLSRGAATRDEDVKVQDSMTWQFYGGTLDPAKRTRDNIVFFFGMQPSKLIYAVGLPLEDANTLLALREEQRKLRAAATASDERSAQRKHALLDWEAHSARGGRMKELEQRRQQTERELEKLAEPVVQAGLQMKSPDPGDLSRLQDFLARRCSYSSMMDGLDEMSTQEQLQLYLACLVMERDKRKVIVGRERLKAMNKRVGERFTVSGMNYPGVDLEVEVLGAFPDGRYNQSALMSRQYILDGMEDWKRKNGREHPLAQKTLNLVWLRVADTETFRQVAEDITTSPLFKTPAVKTETASSGVASFLDAYRDLLAGMRYLMVPAILVTMALVISASISISVRERRTEMAVLKVLGFQPWQIMVLVLGEAVLIGAGSGLLSACASWLVINQVVGGVKFPIAFFPAFKIPAVAMLWGPMIGGGTALFGSVLPAWTARSVKVSEVFSKIS